MKKIVAFFLFLGVFMSSPLTFADVLPIGSKYIPGCAMLQNISAFPKVKFIAAYYPFFEGTAGKLSKIDPLVEGQCLHTGLKGAWVAIFAVDPSQYAEASKSKDYNPQNDLHAYPIPSTEGFPQFDTSDELVDLKAKDTFFHRMYRIEGFDNSKRLMVITHTENQTNLGNKKVTTTALTPRNLSPELTTTMPIFKDVGDDSPYAKAFLKLKRDNIIQGYSDGTVRPQNLINRAEFAKIVMSDYEPLKNYDCGVHSFNDVSTSATNWYRNSVCIAYHEQIIEGYDDKTFKPDQPITFAEAAKIMIKARHIVTSSKTDPWYKQYTNIFEQIKAVPTSIKSPDQKITRGEMALLMHDLREHEYEI